MAWGTIAVIAFTVVFSLLAMLFYLGYAPISLPVLHAVNLVCLVNIIFMCVQKQSKVWGIINKVALIILTPTYLFFLFLYILRFFSMHYSTIQYFRYAMLRQNFVYFSLCAVILIYFSLPIITALVNSIYVIKSNSAKNLSR